MKRNIIFGLAAAAALAFSAHEASAKDMTGWIISGGAGVASGGGYNLYNTDQKLFLDYKDRAGVNLGWISSPSGNIEFKRQAGAGAIKCGDVFALKVGKSYVNYEKGSTFSVGISLQMDSKLTGSSYQWKFACPSGQDVPLNQPVTLVNTKVNDSVVGCKRTSGVNLCWASDVESRLGFNVRKGG